MIRNFLIENGNIVSVNKLNDDEFVLRSLQKLDYIFMHSDEIIEKVVK